MGLIVTGDKITSSCGDEIDVKKSRRRLEDRLRKDMRFLAACLEIADEHGLRIEMKEDES